MAYSIPQNTQLSLRHSLVLTNGRHTSFYRSMRNSRKNCLKSKLPGSFLELKQKATIHSHWQKQEAEQQAAGMETSSAEERPRHHYEG